MRMGGFSCLTRQRLPPVTHTDALFANQSQSILDNLVALLVRAQPEIARTQNAVIRNTSGLAKLMKRAPDNVRYLGQFGEHILTRSFTARDP